MLYTETILIIGVTFSFLAVAIALVACQIHKERQEIRNMMQREKQQSMAAAFIKREVR